MPNKKQPTRTNRKSSPNLDFAILKHLCSPKRNEGIRYLGFDKEDYQKARNRLRYLKKICKEDYETFVSLCYAHEIKPQGLDSKTTKVEIYSSEASTVPSEKQKKQEFIDNTDTEEEEDGTDDEDFINFEVEEPPVHKLSTKRTPSKRQTVTKELFQEDNMVEQNKFGDLLKVNLPNGLVFCTAWVDAKLDPTILKIVVSSDGMRVEHKEATPLPVDGKELLTDMYDWAHDDHNIVVQHLNDEVKSMKRDIDSNEKWVTKTLVTLEEKVIRSFVNIDGIPNNEIKTKLDPDGRQRISFFLKTVKSHEATPEAGNFISCNGRNGYTMDTDNISFDEETIDDFRADMETKIGSMKNEIKTDLQDMFSKLYSEMANLKVSAEVQRQAQAQAKEQFHAAQAAQAAQTNQYQHEAAQQHAAAQASYHHQTTAPAPEPVRSSLDAQIDAQARAEAEALLRLNGVYNGGVYPDL